MDSRGSREMETTGIAQAERGWRIVAAGVLEPVRASLAGAQVSVREERREVCKAGTGGVVHGGPASSARHLLPTPAFASFTPISLSSSQLSPLRASLL